MYSTKRLQSRLPPCNEVGSGWWMSRALFYPSIPGAPLFPFALLHIECLPMFLQIVGPTIMIK